MTTITEATAPAEPIDERPICPKCNTPGRQIPELTVCYCDACGKTWDTEHPEEAEPTEVTVIDPPTGDIKGNEIEVHATTTPAQFDAAADLDEAVIPGIGEIRALAVTARIMAMSSIVPKALQAKPADVFVVLMTGRDLGVSVTTALNNIHVIEGRPSLAPKLMNARLRSLGLGSIKKLAVDNRHAKVAALEPGGRIDTRCKKLWITDMEKYQAAKAAGMEDTAALYVKAAGEHMPNCSCVGIVDEVDFTWEDAQMGGLVMADCQPGQHTAKCLDYRSKGFDRCRQGYRTYPQRMMLWRATGWCADENFPEATMGLYSPEELGAMVDEHGDPVDPGTVELPAGFEPPPNAAQQAAAEPAPPDVIAALDARIKALSAEARATLKKRWDAKAHEDPPRLNKLADLRVSQVPLASSLVAGVEPPPSAPGAGESPGVAPDPSEAPATAPAANPGPTATVEHVEAAIAAVSVMSEGTLNAQLKDRVLATTGNEDVRRANLARVLADEYAQVEWDLAHAEAGS